MSPSAPQPESRFKLRAHVLSTQLTMKRNSNSVIQLHPSRLFAVSAQARSSSSTSVKRLSTLLGQPSPTPSAANECAAKAANKKEGKQNKSNKKEKPEKSNLKMATGVNEPSLKDLSHPSCNDQLKAYNTATFKLVKTGKQNYVSTSPLYLLFPNPLRF